MTERMSIIQRWLDAIGLGQVQTWPVIKGNQIVAMQIRTSVILSAQIGTTTRIKGGGYVRKIRDDTWVQWQWFPDQLTAQAVAIPQHEPGREEPPPESEAPSAADRDQQKPV